MATFAGAGLGTTLVPGVLWARVQDTNAQRISLAMVNEALKLSGIEISEEEKNNLVEAANRNLSGYEGIRKLHIPADVSPPFHFSPVVPGMTVNKTRLRRRMGAVPDPLLSRIEDGVRLSLGLA